MITFLKFNTYKAFLPVSNPVLKETLNPFQITFKGDINEDKIEISPFLKDEIHPVLRKIISGDESKIELYNFLRKNIDSSKRTTVEERQLKPASLEQYDDKTMIRIISLKTAGFENIFDIGEDENLFNKVLSLINPSEDGTAVLEDGSVLSRPLLPKEIGSLMSNKTGRTLLNEDTEGLQNYINLMDSGLKPIQCIVIGANKEVMKKYKILTTPANKEGQAAFPSPDGTVYLSSTLFPSEAAAIVLAKHSELFAPDKVQAFIDLKDKTGFSNEEILNYIQKPSHLRRLKELLALDKKDDEPIELTDTKGKKTVISRRLSTEEAPYALKMKNDKIKIYVDLIDGGLNPQNAASVASSIHRLNRYKELTTEREDGTAVLLKEGVITVLPRPLTPDEAITVITHRSIFTNERIKYDLKNSGRIEVSGD